MKLIMGKVCGCASLYKPHNPQKVPHKLMLLPQYWPDANFKSRYKTGPQS